MKVQTYEDLFEGWYHNWKYNETTWFILHSGGTQYCYLLEGEREALLIDTGLGQGNIRDYAEHLTSKPVRAICTHAHGDHFGGCGWWEECMMQEDDGGMLREHQSMLIEPDKKPYPNFRILPVRDGDVIDLGNRPIEIIEIPAHADSSIALLDKQTRLLFVGDEIECRQVLMLGEMVSTREKLLERFAAHKKNMEKLKARADEFDFVCPAHNGAPLSRDILDDFIALDEELLEGRQYNTKTLRHTAFDAMNTDDSMLRAEHGYAAFIYRNSDKGGNFT